MYVYNDIDERSTPYSVSLTRDDLDALYRILKRTRNSSLDPADTEFAKRFIREIETRAIGYGSDPRPEQVRHS